MTKILVTGAGALLGQGILRSLRASTLAPHIVAVDPSPLSAGLYWADSAHLIEAAKSPFYLERLCEILDAERPDVLLPGTDVELAILAEARPQLEAAFGVETIVSDPGVVRIADDKWLTYQCMSSGTATSSSARLPRSLTPSSRSASAPKPPNIPPGPLPSTGAAMHRS